MHPLIATRQDSIVALCHRFGVRRLEVFGSLLRDDFDSAKSDVDLVVEFGPDFPGGAVNQYFGLKDALEALFHRRVDLIELALMENSRLKRLIERSKVLVYASSA